MAHISGDPGLLRPSPTAGRAPRHRRRGVRRGAGAGEQRAAPLCQGHQLRPDLRHERLRPGQEPGHRDQGGRRLHRPLLPALPRRARYMDETKAAAKARATWRPCSAAACTCPRSTRPTARAAPAPSAPAINAPMQGTAADLIKLAWWRCSRCWTPKGRATRMIMQVHDELVFEVPEAEVDWLRGRDPRLMAGVAELKVPLLAEVGVGPNWDQAHCALLKLRGGVWALRNGADTRRSINHPTPGPPAADCPRSFALLGVAEARQQPHPQPCSLRAGTPLVTLAKSPAVEPSRANNASARTGGRAAAAPLRCRAPECSGGSPPQADRRGRFMERRVSAPLRSDRSRPAERGAQGSP
jgi:hypothetical protein